MPLDGVDISENQGAFADGAFDDVQDFVMVRACYGDHHVDVQAINNVRIARAAGKLVGHYCYALPSRSSGPTQARFFLDSIAELQPGEVLALDVEEETDQLDWWIDQFARVIIDETGRPPLVYCNHDFLIRWGLGTATALNCGLWIAEPDGDPNNVNGSISPWGFAAMKQFAWGSFPLAGRNVSQDVFYGDADQFRAYGGVVIDAQAQTALADPDASGEASSADPGGMAESADSAGQPQSGSPEADSVPGATGSPTDASGAGAG